MKKTISLLMAIMLVASLFAMVNVSAADAVVYVDGTKGKDVADGATGTKDNPFNNMVDAFAALSKTGGTVSVIGDVDIGIKGKGEPTSDIDVSLIIELPKAEKRITVTSEGGSILFTNQTPKSYNYIRHYGDVTYKDAKFVMNSSYAPVFCSFGGHFIVESGCEFTGSRASGMYIWFSGVCEWRNAFKPAHVFSAKTKVTLRDEETGNWNEDRSEDIGSVFVLDGNWGTFWNGTSIDLTTNTALIVKKGANLTTFWGGGQCKSVLGSVYLYNEGGTIGTANAQSNNKVDPAKSFIIGATGTNFKATEVDWTVAEANENAALFNKVEKEYKVTGDVGSFIRVANVSADAKLYAIVDGAAVEMKYLATEADGVFFTTVEGATNYVFADDVKEEQKPTEGEGDKDDSAADTSDPIALIAIFAVVSLAGVVVFKKVR